MKELQETTEDQEKLKMGDFQANDGLPWIHRLGEVTARKLNTHISRLSKELKKATEQYGKKEQMRMHTHRNATHLRNVAENKENKK